MSNIIMSDLPIDTLVEKISESVYRKIRQDRAQEEGGTMTKVEAAKRLGLSRAKVYNLIRDGKLTCNQEGRVILASIKDYEQK